MLNPSIQFKKLSISEAFAEKFEYKLSETCYLEVPTGEIHEVALVKENDELSFKHGWDQFVERHSIGYGYFITFTYTENSHFNVSIFTPTACEIAYPSYSGSTSRVRNDDDDDIGDDSNEYLDSENPSLSPANEENSDDEVIAISDDNDEINSEEMSEISETISDPDDLSEGTQLPKWLVKRYEKELNFVASAGIRLPKNPFFVKSVSEFVLSETGFLNIPKQFDRDYLRCESGTAMKLKMSDGNQWVVQYCRNISSISESCACILCQGWPQFAKESGIYLGDVCLFELTDAKNWVIKVHVAKPSHN